MTQPVSETYLPSKIDAVRFWVVFMWALSFSAGVGVMDWAARYLYHQADRESILLVPDQAVDEARRNELSLKLGAEPGVASASWLTPADQAHRLQSQFPDERWKEAYPADPNWLPWVLEVKPADPINNRDLLTAFIARRQQEGGWQVYWDGSTLDQIANQEKLTRRILLTWIMVMAVAGAWAIANLPKPKRPIVFALTSGVTVAIVPLAVWAVFQLSDAQTDHGAFFFAAVTGFVLACFIAPVLGLRRIPGQPAASTFSTTVEEAPDERVR